MFITEFDTRQSNIDERARDFEDFMRMAFSYPNVKDRLKKKQDLMFNLNFEILTSAHKKASLTGTLCEI